MGRSVRSTGRVHESIVLPARRRRVLALVVIGVVMAATSACSSEPEMRILFIGNSLTFGNDLPDMVDSLAGSAGVGVEVEDRSQPGWWLRDHAASAGTVELIESGDWDVVVLQEQSILPSVRDQARSEMFPAAIALANRATMSGSDVLLFETWGHRGGSAEVGHPSYNSMQAAISSTYADLGEHLGKEVAPVGQAWASAMVGDLAIALYEDDGYHPSREGSYLAAIVITATIFDVDPTGLDSLGLDDDVAASLRDSAVSAMTSTP
jgi:hypothetical protein